MKKLIKIKYKFNFHYITYKYIQNDSFKQILPTLPKPPQNITITKPTIKRSYFKYKTP